MMIQPEQRDLGSAGWVFEEVLPSEGLCDDT